MPIQPNEENDRAVLVVPGRGKRDGEEDAGFVPAFGRPVGLPGKLRGRLDLTDFHGWAASAVFWEVKFADRHFSGSERIALVGEARGRHGLATFAPPFTRATVRSFDQADRAKALVAGSLMAPPV